MSTDPIVDAETGEIIDERPAPLPLALLKSPEQQSSLETYRGAGQAPITQDEGKALMAPTNPELLSFKWGDRKKSFALAYVSQVEYRRRLNSIFWPGGWALVPLSPPKANEDGTVVYHGALYIRGCFAAEACGEHQFRENNDNTSWATALESAKSDCLTRCCKDLGMFSECWDKKWIEPHQEAWVKQQQRKCPGCGGSEFFGQDREDKSRWFCWKNKDRGKLGCGWQGNPDETSAPPASTTAGSSPAGPSPSPARQAAPPPPPESAPANRKADAAAKKTYTDALTAICKLANTARTQAEAIPADDTARVEARNGYLALAQRLSDMSVKAIDATSATPPKDGDWYGRNAPKLEKALEEATLAYGIAESSDLPF